MANTRRVHKELFSNNVYLGKPADEEDKIITRRIEVLERYPEFFGKSYDCIEVGCGSGSTINRLAHRFNNVVGVDIFDYKSAFDTLKDKYGALNSSFHQLNLEATLPDAKFDRLISFEVIEHLHNEQSVQQYNRVLNPGAMIAISVPNKWWIFETHGAKLPLLPWNRVPMFSWLPTPIHEKFANARIYTMARITRLLENCGFAIIDTAYITAPMDVLKEGPLKRWLVKNIFRSNTTPNPFLSTSIFVIAHKQKEV
jgi:2-polyprenyl-3-methyl-5-hydroxy-6-metoxy-1,4-benzoquinol methylase